MDFKAKLNTNQYKACISNATYLRIIAGAGTGKTRTLSHKIAYHIYNGIKPNQIVAITFTNKAAREMLDRVTKLLNEENISFDSSPIITTFHSFCYSFLKKEIGHLNKSYTNAFSIADDEDQNKLLKNIFIDFRLDSVKEKCQLITSFIRKKKQEGKLPSDLNDDDFDDLDIDYKEVLKIFETYQNSLEKQNLLDFDDLIIFTKKIMENDSDIRRFWQKKFRMFFIDEFQDTDIIQYKLIKLFLNTIDDDKITRLIVVGDPDQTIYTWRGADSRIIKDLLQKDFNTLETIVLDENYRSTKQILDVSNKLINNNFDRLKKDLRPFNNRTGEEVELNFFYSAKEEANFISSTIKKMISSNNYKYSDFAILYRSNYLSNSIEKQLIQNKIPYSVYGGLKFYDRKEVKDTLAYLKLILNPNDDLSFLRILQAPPKGIGESSIIKAREIIGESKISLLEYFKTHEGLKITSTSESVMKYFYDAYDNFISEKDAIKDYTQIFNYLSEVGIEEYIKKLDYLDSKKNSLTSNKVTERIDNYYELLNDLKEYISTTNVDIDGNETQNTLIDYINNLTLQSSQDYLDDKDEVLLLTCHVAKGLEFKVVFLCGLNQQIFPTSHSLESGLHEDIEEERRLCYVACTRAQDKLFISTYTFGNRPGTSYTPSIFIKELGFEKKNIERRESIFSTFDNYSAKFEGDYSFSRNISKAIKYKIGDKVIHEKFGVGEVVDLDDKTIMINFEAYEGLKKIIITADQLKKLGD